ncbi:MAG: rhodanese-like domain-containing protein [Candidatus Dormibacteraeota bacterium]|nr:rhodanese-like domain-containing protein [Candidatus Dormibacteraeota bacterium]
MQIVVLETPELGDRSYLIHDGVKGLVVDPQRDIDRMLAEIKRAAVTITHVFETHIHNDYVTGGLALSRAVGAEYGVAASDAVDFPRLAILDSDEFEIGTMVVRAVHTPGHTPNHMSYVVSEGGQPRAVLSGGSLLYGTVGRTDLISPDLTDRLTRDQFHSARRLISDLPEETRVLPTHGFGSFCASSGTSTSGNGDIASERRANLAAQIPDESEFVSRVISGLGPYPAYYERMAPLNRVGPKAFDPTQTAPTPDPEEIRRRIAAGAWVIDTRPRRNFATSHLAGTLGFELDSAYFSTYVGWLAPSNEPLTILTEGTDEQQRAVRDLSRIGVDRVEVSPAGFSSHAAAAEVRGYPVTDFAGLARQLNGTTAVLDVRQRAEWSSGHIRGSHNIPVQEIPGRLDEVPRGDIFVHCGIGYRASVAASLLDRAGHSVTLVDDDFNNAERVGLPLES